MSTPTFDDVVTGVSSQGIEALKLVLKDSWEAMTAQERSDCLQFLVVLTRARLYEIIGRDVSHFMPVLDAALVNWKALGKQVVADAIKNVAAQMFGFAGAFAGSALLALIKGAV